MSAGASSGARVRVDSQLVTSYVLFVAVAAFLVALFAAPSFRVNHVTVTGSPAAQSEVDAAAGVSGLNIFTIRAATVLNAVRRVPNVLPCGVTLAFPNTVTVCVKTRRAVIGWRTADGLDLVDKYGRVIAAAGSTDLPVLRDTTRLRRAVGSTVNPWIAFGAHYILQHMVHAAIDGFALTKKKGLILDSRHHWTAVLGWIRNGSMLRDRVAILKALISHGFKIGHPLAFADLNHAQRIARWHGISTATGAGY